MAKGTLRESLAEMWGTFVLIAFGCGVNTAVTFGEGKGGDWLNINFGWGVAVILGIIAVGGVTGAHLNPAVTIGLAAFRGFPAGKVIPYIAAQVLGAFLGAALVFGVYWDTFQKVDPSRSEIASTGVFCTYPAQHINPIRGGLVDQIAGTALLMATVLALGSPKNRVPAGLGVLFVGLTVLGIGISFGTNAGYAINPARDFGPRLFALVAGWKDVFTANQNYFWVPIVGPIVGALVGAVLYDLLVGEREES